MNIFWFFLLELGMMIRYYCEVVLLKSCLNFVGFGMFFVKCKLGKRDIIMFFGKWLRDVFMRFF